MGAFRDWLVEIADTPLTVDASGSGLEREALNNQWGFSFTQEQVQGLKAEDVSAFLCGVVDIYHRQLLERFGWEVPCVFYCWFDEQASELRFSLVSASHGSLPFGCPIEVVDDVNPLQVWVKELPTEALRPIGLAEGEFIVPDDFDAPLPEEILRDFEGR